MRIFVYLFPFVLGAVVACEECDECGPVQNDPSFTIEFYAKQTNRAAQVMIDTINGEPAGALNEAFRRIGTAFRLPLSANADSSSYELIFTEYSNDLLEMILEYDSVFFLDTLVTDDTIQFEPDTVIVPDTTFVPDTLVNIDTLQIFDSLRYKRFLNVAYSRETYESNGEVRMRAVNFRIIDKGDTLRFDSAALIDPKSTGISNEITIRVFL